MSNTLFVLLVFFEISEKNDFWMPFTRESVAKLIFRFVPHSFLRLVKYFFLLVFIKKKVYEISLIN
ncbi:hypothetical protein EAI85_08245, partial [Enterococcus durans]